jgi:Ribosomal protein L11 methyltransferase (PrmA)/Arginine methyltransferase oligomerization subdomain
MSVVGYSLTGYGDMIADRVRMEAYAQALRAAVRPGSVVVDIGTGPGIMAVLACQFGASRVFAIEPGEIIQVAREIAAANRCADRIEFFENVSTKVKLPVRADVIVSDLRGILPLLEQNIPSIVDARRRFLAPGGTMIAQEDRIWVAVAEAPERYGKIVDPWEHNALGQDLSPARRMAVNEHQRVRLTPEQLLTKPRLWATLDYAFVENPDVRSELNWTVERDGTGHGMVAWFETELADGVGFSNAPSEPEAIYGSMFFPWLAAAPLAAGQSVHVDLQAKLMEKDYFWRWTTRIDSANAPGKTIAHFDQSQLQGTALSPGRLVKTASDYVPVLSEEGLIRRRVFDLMDGKASLETIARRLTAEFPERFMRWQQALSFAGQISTENSR